MWDTLLQTLVDSGLTDDRQPMIDGTTVRGHVSAAGAKRGIDKEAICRSRGGFIFRIHARCNDQGRPLGSILTGGEAWDCKAVDALMALPVAKPKALLADQCYDGDGVRSSLLMRGMLSMIPPKANRRSPSHASCADSGTVAASSACSDTSSTNAASPPDTTSPLCPLPASSTPPLSADGYQSLSTDPKHFELSSRYASTASITAPLA